MRTVDNNHALREQAMARMRALITAVENDVRVPVDDDREDELARVVISLRKSLVDE